VLKQIRTSSIANAIGIKDSFSSCFPFPEPTDKTHESQAGADQGVLLQ
jgi:hypothetical protein